MMRNSTLLISVGLILLLVGTFTPPAMSIMVPPSLIDKEITISVFDLTNDGHLQRWFVDMHNYYLDYSGHLLLKTAMDSVISGLNIKVSVNTDDAYVPTHIALSRIDLANFDPDLVILLAQGNIVLNTEQKEAILQYLEDGGIVLIDDVINTYDRNHALGYYIQNLLVEPIETERVCLTNKSQLIADEVIFRNVDLEVMKVGDFPVLDFPNLNAITSPSVLPLLRVSDPITEQEVTVMGYVKRGNGTIIISSLGLMGYAYYKWGYHYHGVPTATKEQRIALTQLLLNIIAYSKDLSPQNVSQGSQTQSNPISQGNITVPNLPSIANEIGQLRLTALLGIAMIVMGVIVRVREHG